jgi:hypothetical protein
MQTVSFSPPNQLTQQQYQKECQLALPITMIKLVVGNLSHSEADIEEIIKACQEKPDEQRLIQAILSEVDKYTDQPDLKSIEIDLQADGKFRLENSDEGIVLIKCSDNYKDQDTKLGIMPNCNLEQFLENRTLLKGFSIVDARTKTPENLEGDFFLVNEKSKQEDFEEFLVMDDKASKDTEPENAYLNELIKKTSSTKSTLGSGIFEVALNAFVGASDEAGHCVNKDQIVTKDFVIYNHVIQGEVEAKKFIEAHQKDNALVLVPYGVTDRDHGENHLVLLAIKGNETAIIDPKFGIDIGQAVPKKDIVGLKWQGMFDVNNCGFYVYHMLTMAITASLGQQFYAGKEEGSLCADLSDFFKQEEKEPTPESIRNAIRKIIEPMDSPETISSTAIITTTTTSSQTNRKTHSLGHPFTFNYIQPDLIGHFF